MENINHSICREMGNLLQQSRLQKGLTQKELSGLTGISQANISLIEQGKANPSLETIARIADCLEQKVIFDLIFINEGGDPYDP